MLHPEDSFGASLPDSYTDTTVLNLVASPKLRVATFALSLYLLYDPHEM